jgi:hypothetical protein
MWRDYTALNVTRFFSIFASNYRARRWDICIFFYYRWPSSFDMMTK